METLTLKTTQELLKEMLTENTGKSFLDSGGGYGRHWQKNQDRDFDSEPEVFVDFILGEGEYSVNVYHYLASVLDVDETSDRVNKFLRDQDCHWWHEGEEVVRANFPVEKFSDPINTYNSEENLSQVLLFQVFSIGDQCYVLLQIHQGCDVRGGYTDVRCFRLCGLLTGLVDVIGCINGYPCDNFYDGVNITDEEGQEIPFPENSEYEFFIHPALEEDLPNLKEIYLN